MVCSRTCCQCILLQVMWHVLLPLQDYVFWGMMLLGVGRGPLVDVSPEMLDRVQVWLGPSRTFTESLWCCLGGAFGSLSDWLSLRFWLLRTGSSLRTCLYLAPTPRSPVPAAQRPNSPIVAPHKRSLFLTVGESFRCVSFKLRAGCHAHLPEERFPFLATLDWRIKEASVLLGPNIQYGRTCCSLSPSSVPRHKSVSKLIFFVSHLLFEKCAKMSWIQVLWNWGPLPTKKKINGWGSSRCRGFHLQSSAHFILSKDAGICSPQLESNSEALVAEECEATPRPSQLTVESTQTDFQLINL